MSMTQLHTTALLDAATDDSILGAISALQRLSDLFEQRREQLARSVGLTVQQWHLLEEITDEHFMPSMFAKRRESSAAAVSKIIRQLLDKTLITVAIDQHDGRLRRYHLTPAGQKLMHQLRKNRQEAIDAIWAGFTPEQLDNFQNFALELSNRLEHFSNKQSEMKPWKDSK